MKSQSTVFVVLEKWCDDVDDHEVEFSGVVAVASSKEEAEKQIWAD